MSDAFAAKLGYSKALGSALIKLHAENLNATDMDWLYSTFRNSHPTLIERLAAIGWEQEGRADEKKSSDESDAKVGPKEQIKKAETT